jgi:protein TonB
MKKLFLFVAVAVMYCSCVEVDTKDSDASLVNDKGTELVDEAENEQDIPMVDDVILVPDVIPEFPGGEDSLFAFLSRNIKYPAEAKKADIRGRVFVTFVVEKDGRITGERILRDIGGGCGEEVLRVIRTMPKWKPGTQDDTPVRVQFNLPVAFELQDEDKE